MSAFATKALKSFEFKDPNGEPARVWYKAKMTLADEAELQERYLQMKLPTERSNGRSPDMQLTVSLKRQKLELLKMNLKKWEGVWFMEEGKLVPCIPRNIDLLDSTENDYWIDELADLIGETNKPKILSVEDGDPDDLKKTQGEQGLNT